MVRPNSKPPTPFVVYAVSVGYFAAHFPATASSYSLSVPPGVYGVVARFDDEPLRGGGWTYGTQCAATRGCDPAKTPRHEIVFPVRVESEQVVTGIDIRDWESKEVRQVLWNLDTSASPLRQHPEVPPPSPQPLASRAISPTPSTTATKTFTLGHNWGQLKLPVDWSEVKLPPAFDDIYTSKPDELYFANEKVKSPLELDGKGTWMTLRTIDNPRCPDPDLTFATSKATFPMQFGSTDLFFEDPPPRDGPQPFVGYKVRGCTKTSSLAYEYIFTGVTKAALEDNLGAFFGVMASAQLRADLHSP
jgi:hypothetical protein